MKKKYHLKKKVKLFLGIVLVVVIGVVLGIILLTKKEPTKEVIKELQGELLTDYVYKYDLSKTNNVGYSIYDNSIYYLVDKDTKTEIYKRDIYEKDSVLLGTLPKEEESFIYLKGNYIHYAIDNKEVIYNYKMEVVQEITNNGFYEYKDSFIIKKDNILYYQDKEFRKLDDKVKDMVVANEFIFDNTTLLYFIGEDDKINYLYNITDDTYELVKYDSMSPTENGLMLFDKDKILLKDINNNETKTYTNPYPKDNIEFNIQIDKNNNMYYFKNDYLRIYDLEKQTVNLFDYRLNIEPYRIILKDNLLFLVNSDLSVYVIEVDKISTKEYTDEELNKYFEDKLNNKIDKIEKKYNIDIKTKEECDLTFDFWNQKIVGEYDYDKIDEALDDIEKVFNKFGDKFFDNFYFNEYKGVRVYIVNNFQAENPIAGQAFVYYDTFTVMVDTTTFAQTLCHEIMHSMEEKAEYNNNILFKKWNNYNPKGFKYSKNYSAYYGTESKYIANTSDDHESIYFVDAYSTIEGLEDRARVFEYICSDQIDVINNNPHLVEKAKYLRDELYKEFPKLKDTHIFDKLKD